LEDKLGHLSLVVAHDTLTIRANPPLQIATHWCEQHGGSINQEGSVTYYRVPRSDRAQELGKAITMIYTSRFADETNKYEFMLGDAGDGYDTQELRYFDRVDDELFHEQTKDGITICKHSVWDNIPVLDSLSQLFEYFRAIRFFSSDSVIWRGHSRIGYKLDSSLMREVVSLNKTGRSNPHLFNLSDLDSPDSENGYMSESGLLESRLRYDEHRRLSASDHRGFSQRDGRSLNDLELFSLLQHQGGRTRLLDFTWNMNVALWFACNHSAQHRDAPGLLLGIVFHAAKNRHLTYVRTREQLQMPLNALLDDPENEDQLFAWQPPYHNPRMHVQQSVMVFSKCETTKYGTTPLPYYNRYDPWSDSQSVFRVGLSAKFKQDVRFKLENLYGYNHSRMYPDFEGFAQHWDSREF
jgi:hypothetical protein